MMTGLVTGLVPILKEADGLVPVLKEADGLVPVLKEADGLVTDLLLKGPMGDLLWHSPLGLQEDL
jgi:hypothetical protein